MRVISSVIIVISSMMRDKLSHQLWELSHQWLELSHQRWEISYLINDQWLELSHQWWEISYLISDESYHWYSDLQCHTRAACLDGNMYSENQPSPDGRWDRSSIYCIVGSEWDIKGIRSWGELTVSENSNCKIVWWASRRQMGQSDRVVKRYRTELLNSMGVSSK